MREGQDSEFVRQEVKSVSAEGGGGDFFANISNYSVSFVFAPHYSPFETPRFSVRLNEMKE